MPYTNYSSPFGSPKIPEAVYGQIALFALSILAILFALLGLLSVTGAIGLWLLTRWGRNLVAWLQVPDILLGIVIMALAGLREVRVSGLTGVFIILGLSTIAFSVVMG